MKKVFLFALATAVMSFAGCQEKEQEAPVNPNEGGSTFEFVADIAQTKTTLDVENGYKVDWEEGDLVYMVTSDGTWGKPYNDDKYAATIAEFKYADGKFTSDATIAAAEYTFKGMYAAASQKPYHRGASSTHKLEATQTQDCANPTAHIKANDALVGTFTATVPMEEMAKMNMSHLYTLMRVNVKNATGAAVEVTRFEMTAEGADLAGIFNVTAFDTPALTTKQDATSTITVNLTGGSVEKDASLPVYFVMAPLSDYAGDVTFKVTDSEGKTYTKTVKMNGISFEAGMYNTTPYTIKAADVVEPEPEGVKTATISFASTAQRTSYSTTQQVWENEGVVFTNDKAKSTTNVADYSNPVRLYKSSTITISAPGNITKVEFNSSTGEYLANLKNSLTGYSANNNSVVMELDGSSNSVTYTLSGGQVRLNSLTVTYVGGDYVPPVLESISISGYKTEFVQDETFSFGGVVTATYDNGDTRDVTNSATFSGYNMSNVGTQTVTVEYEGVTTTYEITIEEKPVGAKYWKKVTDASTLKAGDVIRIGCDTRNTAAGSMGSQKYFASVSATFSNGVMTSDKAIDITLSGTTGAWILTTNEGTIGTSAAKALNKTGAGTKTWTISISNGNATIKSTNTSYGWIQYNASSPRFLNYASNQTAIQIYRYE